MNRITQSIVGALLLVNGISHAQLSSVASDSIEINTLKAKVFADGRLVEVQTLDSGKYKTLLYTEAMWIGGLDSPNNLHQSSMTYRQGQADFYPGPISNDPQAFHKYNKVYKVNLQTLTDFKNGMTSGIPSEIANWPAHGDTTMGEAYYLAPFVDVNQDGKYDPADGDYPDIKGDEAIYSIFNDAVFRTGGLAMGIEVHTMVYGYNTGGAEDSILYKEYRVINRSDSAYYDTYFSIFADFDLGNSQDDLIGTNISANSIFAYNADSVDEGPRGFGTRPASCGIRMLQGPPASLSDGIDNDKDGCVDAVRINGICVPEDPVAGIREQILLSGSMSYANDQTVQGNPNTPMEYNNYSWSLWKNGNNLIIENPSGFLNANNGDGYVASNIGTKTMYVFPGNSYDTTGAYPPYSPVNWYSPAIANKDMRVLANAGQSRLEVGEEFTTAIGIVWTRTNDHATGYNRINDLLGNLDTVYKNQPSRYVSLPAYQPQNSYRIAYRQHDGQWLILNDEKKPLEFKLFNVNGQLVQTLQVDANTVQLLNTGGLAPGVYLIVNEGSGSSHKIVK